MLNVDALCTRINMNVSDAANAVMKNASFNGNDNVIVLSCHIEDTIPPNAPHGLIRLVSYPPHSWRDEYLGGN